jgi:hypothetical protein
MLLLFFIFIWGQLGLVYLHWKKKKRRYLKVREFRIREIMSAANILLFQPCQFYVSRLKIWAERNLGSSSLIMCVTVSVELRSRDMEVLHLVQVLP